MAYRVHFLKSNLLLCLCHKHTYYLVKTGTKTPAGIGKVLHKAAIQNYSPIVKTGTNTPAGIDKVLHKAAVQNYSPIVKTGTNTPAGIGKVLHKAAIQN